MRAEDARARDVDVRTFALLFVPRHEREMARFVVRRLKQFEIAPTRERTHPTVIRDRVLLIVIAFDGDDRNPRVVQQSETRHRMVHRFRLNLARVEKIARDEHEINFALNGVKLHHVEPRARKILDALVQVVTSAAEMYIRDMEEFHNDTHTRARGPQTTDLSALVMSLLYDRKAVTG